SCLADSTREYRCPAPAFLQELRSPTACTAGRGDRCCLEPHCGAVSPRRLPAPVQSEASSKALVSLSPYAFRLSYPRGDLSVYICGPFMKLESRLFHSPGFLPSLTRRNTPYRFETSP